MAQLWTRTLFFLLLISFGVLGDLAEDTCVYDDGDTAYDLRGLRNDNADYKWSTVESDFTYSFTLNYCRATIEKCVDGQDSTAAACREVYGIVEPIGIFAPTRARLIPGVEGVSYVAGQGLDWQQVPINFRMNVLCDKNTPRTTSPVLKQGAPNYIFEIRSQYGCAIASSDAGGLSLGWILIIILTVSVTVYLVGGVLFNKFARKQDTSVRLLPNLDFWSSLPALIMDGVRYTVRRVRNPRGNYTTV